RVMDGRDLVQVARGEKKGRALYWRSGPYRSILVDGWKLQVQDRPPKQWLYDLTTDPTEHRNLAASRLDKVTELSAILAEKDGQMVKPAWPSLIEAPIPVDRPLGVTPKPDDEYVTWAN